VAEPNHPEREPPSHRRLLDACIRGDQDAWGELVAQFSRLVYSVPRRYRLPPEACEDVFQEVFAILLKELPQIRDARTLPKWLITVAARESLRAARRRRPEPKTTHRDPPLLPPEELQRLEQHQLIRDCLCELDDPCRALLYELFSPGDPDYSAIAQRLSMPIGSIGPTRARCLKKLLAIVQSKLHEP
jgi:RNA polymerase sigma factor (sigma-70 family)